MPESLIVLARAVIAFISMLVFTRLMGKSEISQLTFFDYITGITVGSIAATLTTDLTVRAFSHWVGLLAWILLAIFFKWISLKNRTLAKILDGEPTILVHNGKILEDNLRANRFRYSDLLEQLRTNGVFTLSDVEFAILETDGTVSVLKKTQAQPLTPADLHLSTSYRGIPTELVQEGKIIHRNLEQLNLSESWLKEELAKQGISDLSQVSYALLDTQGNLYIDQYSDELTHPTMIGDNPNKKGD